MDGNRLDRISKALSQRRLSRRRALATGGAGLAAGALAAAGLAAAQDPATPAAGDATPPGFDPAQKIDFLFVQTFQRGTIAPVEGTEGRYTVTLDGGTGQTIYFADRPDRTVGATPTPQFLEGLGFSDDNPPNAALVVETAPGETDIAVVELFNPLYDPVGRGVTYEVAVLANWQDSLEMGFNQEPAGLATLASNFGAAHLFIDDCPNETIYCMQPSDPGTWGGTFDNQPMCWNYSLCIPCEPYGHVQPDRCSTQKHWNDKCNATYPVGCPANSLCYAEWDWPGSEFLCWE